MLDIHIQIIELVSCLLDYENSNIAFKQQKFTSYFLFVRTSQIPTAIVKTPETTMATSSKTSLSNAHIFKSIFISIFYYKQPGSQVHSVSSYGALQNLSQSNKTKSVFSSRLQIKYQIPIVCLIQSKNGKCNKIFSGIRCYKFNHSQLPMPNLSDICLYFDFSEQHLLIKVKEDVYLKTKILPLIFYRASQINIILLVESSNPVIRIIYDFYILIRKEKKNTYLTL
ncbi:hypothetical protein TTHERM_000833719 (macronuclear) [Tetrahymena thermophila SB210]|uniref:Uncharacterized protein n=1 Tax=Tetrahymena thermophila (strain SB210) TaxID=312017 RepID=W7XKL0_TETTS|nr:hypothetical protein TTHERM_000833719 [Tetrahymena thermophila SB210]EWS74989.1 hypothetical protein TTHERM_000833719 [Tetrahymena thermophila SB210]|eukprot:XP_012652488.1 hypothetical protein TTHERM_000833719 [Tetrahymena thermophila SB210]